MQTSRAAHDATYRPGVGIVLLNTGNQVFVGRRIDVEDAWQDSAIDVATPNPEFDAWRWVQPLELSTLAVSFKRRLYLSVLAEFPTIFRD
jgi:hypothetical protein